MDVLSEELKSFKNKFSDSCLLSDKEDEQRQHDDKNLSFLIDEESQAIENPKLQILEYLEDENLQSDSSSGENT